MIAFYFLTSTFLFVLACDPGSFDVVGCGTDLCYPWEEAGAGGSTTSPEGGASNDAGPDDAQIDGDATCSPLCP